MTIYWMADEDYAAAQAADQREAEQERLRRALAAALRRSPSPRETRRARAAWEGG